MDRGDRCSIVNLSCCSLLFNVFPFLPTKTKLKGVFSLNFFFVALRLFELFLFTAIKREIDEEGDGEEDGDGEEKKRWREGETDEMGQRDKEMYRRIGFPVPNILMQRCTCVNRIGNFEFSIRCILFVLVPCTFKSMTDKNKGKFDMLRNLCTLW